MKSRTRSRPTSAALRAHVVETALSSFSERGYGAVSVEMICSAAQVSVGSLYHHFGNKAGVAAAVYAEALRRYHDTLLAVVSRNPNAGAGIRALAQAHHEWVAAESDWACFMVSAGDLAEIQAEAAAHDAANARLAAALTAWARPLMDQGHLVTLDPLVFMAVMFGPSYFHTRASLSGSANPPDQVVAADFAAAAWRSLRGPAATAAV